MKYVLEVEGSKKTTKKDSEGNPLLSVNLVAYFLNDNKEKGEKFLEQKVEVSEAKLNVAKAYYNAVINQSFEALKRMIYCRDRLIDFSKDISRTERASIMSKLEAEYLRELQWVTKISNNTTLEGKKAVDLTDSDIIKSSIKSEIMYHSYNLSFDKKYKF